MNRRRLLPFVAAGAFLALGHVVPAALLMGLGTGLVQLDLVRPDRARRFDHAVATAAVAVGRWVGAIALGAIWVLLLVPAASVLRLLRREPLDPGPRWRSHPQAEGPVTDRPYALEPHATGPVPLSARLATGLPLVVGWLVVAGAANYAGGWLWDEVVGTHELPAAVALAPSDDPEDLVDRPALRDAPWALDHLRSYLALEYRYRSYLMEELVDGRYGDIVIEGAFRRTHEPTDLPADAPEVWVFGGSTVFGKGQRDEHTIASALAGVADAEGTPARVRNFGNPGYTSYQEWLLFERRLAEGPAPAVAVFLDGTADLEVQDEVLSRDPTHFNLRGVDSTVTGEGGDELDDLPDRYLEDSLLGKLWRTVGGVFGAAPAGAAGDDGSMAANAADLGNRARALVEHLGEREGVPVVFAREPTPAGGPTRGAYEQVTEVLEGTDVDLSDLLVDQGDLYLDWIHVNEEGARLVAEALYPAVARHLS